METQLFTTATEAARGFATSLGLIVAIGAQNAFVLRQGLKREHVALVALFCGLSDALLIAAGVAGLGVLVQAQPLLLTGLRWFGAAFLLAYGVAATRRAMRASSLQAAATERLSIGQCLAMLAGFTFLNPHVYLDTVVLIGALAHAKGEAALPWAFGGGAMLASASWFVALAFGARWLQPLFAKPLAWRILDAGIAVVMFGLAAGLLLGAF